MRRAEAERRIVANLEEIEEGSKCCCFCLQRADARGLYRKGASSYLLARVTRSLYKSATLKPAPTSTGGACPAFDGAL